jgi:hypothetical protein
MHTPAPSSSGPRPAATLRRVVLVTIAIVVLATVGAASGTLAQGSVALAIDPDPTDNENTALGAVNGCRSVAVDEVFDVDIVVENVESLLAFEVYIDFDGALLEIQDRDVKRFLAGNEGSNVIDASNRLPSPSPYRVSGVDISDPPTPDSGSGILARLTFRALAEGEASVGFATVDFNDDGTPDLGPLLRDIDGEPIGDDDDEDVYFDGAAREAIVNIGGECPLDLVVPSDESSGINWGLMGLVAGVALVVAVSGGGILLIARRRSGGV